MRSKLSLMDRAFFLTETNASPKHVAGALELSLPEGKDYRYFLSTVDKLKEFDKAEAPFNATVTSFLKLAISFKTVDKVDMNYHIKIHEIDNMDKKESVDDLIVDLHKKRLDTKKPLWQVHLIYSKSSNKIFLYVKIHHIYGDGITILSWMMKSFSPSKTENFIPFWAVKHKFSNNESSKVKVSPIKSLMNIGVYFVDVFSLLFHNAYRMVKPNRTDNATPFSGQRTVLTGQVTAGRAVTTFKLPLPKVLAACKLTRSTLNDFMLTAIDIAIHRFLKDHAHQGERFEKPLICQMPVSLRSPGDNSEGNKIAIALVKMAHGRLDPYKRLRQIVNSSFLVKQEVKTYSPAAYTHVSLLSQTGALICELLHLSDKIRPLGNLLVSNVPGPNVPLYFGDCKLNSIFPISTIAPGGGLNITLVTYNNEINVGLLCCNNKLDSLEPLIGYITDSLDLLIESINDPSITIDDLGEKSKNENLTIVEDQVEIKST